MNKEEYFKRVKKTIYPQFYSKEVYSSESEFLLQDGSYVFYCLPAEQVDFTDFRNRAIKDFVRSNIFAMPVVAEKGLFVHVYGAQELWQEGSKNLKVDMTALRPVILQNINFIDPASGQSFNNRTSWGSLKFGFCGKVIEAIESLEQAILRADKGPRRDG